VIHTHNGLRLGDNLVQLNFLRRLSLANPELEITHYYNPGYCKVEELDPLRTERILLRPISEAPAESIDSWRNAGGHWERHPDKLNFAQFHLDWFAELASRMGVKNPITTVDDLLFDYPALTENVENFDAIVINSPPFSGQFQNFSAEGFIDLIRILQVKGMRVLSTAPAGICACSQPHDVSWIGAASTTAQLIVGSSTGPSWPCFNVHNRLATHIMCADVENVVLTPRGRVARSPHHAISVLEELGIL